MRPRVFPAEDVVGVVVGVAAFTASMRPRVFPAEDRPARARTAPAVRFNEAAGIPRGRHAWGGSSRYRAAGLQ